MTLHQVPVANKDKVIIVGAGIGGLAGAFAGGAFGDLFGNNTSASNFLDADMDGIPDTIDAPQAYDTFIGPQLPR